MHYFVSLHPILVLNCKKMKKSIFMISLVAAMLMTSCASKKELAACQQENKALQTNYQDTKEQLAAANARVQSLEQQVKGLAVTNKNLQSSAYLWR